MAKHGKKAKSTKPAQSASTAAKSSAGKRTVGQWFADSFKIEGAQSRIIVQNGILDQNPVLVLLLGMCSTLAVTTSVENGIGMGLATTAVLTMSNLVISLLRKVIPSKIRIASYVVVIAGFVTVIDLLMQAFLPELAKSLGIFIQLIVVNCIILGRAEAFASKNTPGYAMLDGLAMGIGFTFALCLMGFVRELLGSGSVLGFQILGANYPGVAIMNNAPGGFITLGCIIAAVQFLKKRKEGGAQK